ncbi:MAG TPA: hypothetical protein VFK06_25690 [Candidatus Angelobacter sp.]|nr:hypothetical protein [Candidatus Angelobacter sp.]
MERADIIAALRRAAEQLGKTPTRGELNRVTGINYYRVQLKFRSFNEAIRAAGLEPHPKGRKITTKDLLRDWRRVKKKLGRRPTRAEYMREGKYSAQALIHRFGAWQKIGGPVIVRPQRRHGRNSGPPQALQHSPEVQSPDSPDKMIAMRWASSLTQVPGPVAGKRRVTEAVAALVVSTLLGENSSWQIIQRNSLALEANHGPKEISHGNGSPSTPCSSVPSVVKPAVKRDRPIMGQPFDSSPLTNAPVNELGVVFLFGILAAELGFQVESLQSNFPDCEARREVQPGRWQRQRIEFEYESKNFERHGHDPRQCDVIVCWRHNWKECPEGLEVVELGKIMR